MRTTRIPPFTPLARRARQAGAVSIELALVSILLATMMFGALDLGRAMYAYNEIVQSTRSAARYLATSTTIGSTEITRARNLVVYGKFSSSGPALSNELTSSNTHIQFCSTTYCDITGKTTADMNNQAVSGATSVNLVMVQVSNLTLVTYFPQVVANMLFRPITVTFPRVS